MIFFNFKPVPCHCNFKFWKLNFYSWVKLLHIVIKRYRIMIRVIILTLMIVSLIAAPRDDIIISVPVQPSSFRDSRTPLPPACTVAISRLIMPTENCTMSLLSQSKVPATTTLWLCGSMAVPAAPRSLVDLCWLRIPSVNWPLLSRRRCGLQKRR